ncbi:MAG: hypothetical protein ACP5IJ_00735, partial [Candidatus Nanoarchaeia archaeon]
KYRVTASAPVFYNPVMRLSRDISILLLKILKPKSAADILAATGVRGFRIEKEAKIKCVYLNDANPIAFAFMQENAKLNNSKAKIFCLRAHEFLAKRYLLKHKKFGYLDIDPFGSPVPFLDAGVKAIDENNGVIGVTATDTSALCGTYPDVCFRRYGAKPLRNYLMHEIGIRILIRKIQEIGLQYDLALKPIFCHATAHYVRVYLKSEKGAKAANQIYKLWGQFDSAGPLWLGELWNAELADKMFQLSRTNLAPNISDETRDLLFMLKEEAKIPVVGFYDVAELKLSQMPCFSDILAALKAKGFLAARTHFSRTGIRTTAPKTDFEKIVKNLLK